MSRDPITDIEVIDTDVDVVVEVTADFIHLCPYKEEVDEGQVVISWRTQHGHTLELHSLAAWLDLFDEAAVSHETLMAHIQDELTRLVGIPVSVVGTFETAGMKVSVTA
jgi:NADPH-dependent 7-cyano-7-deazaguanine reductase QueF